MSQEFERGLTCGLAISALFSLLTLPMRVSPDKARANIAAWAHAITGWPR